MEEFHLKSVLINDTTYGVSIQKELWKPKANMTRTHPTLKDKKRKSKDDDDDYQWPSGSNWNENHLTALHILTGKVEQKYVIPERFMPKDDGNFFGENLQQLNYRIGTIKRIMDSK